MSRGDLPRLYPLAPYLFFFSGLSSLWYQVVWQKVLTQQIGVDHFSLLVIVSVFMLGLGLGGIAGAAAIRRRVNAVRCYAVLELALGLCGFESVSILRAANEWFSGRFDAGYAGDFLLNLALLIVPTILMGMSLPLMIHIFRNRHPAGEVIGRIYSWNIAGAALGVLSAGFLMIGVAGMTATCRLAALINAALAACMILLFSRSREADAEPAGVSAAPEATAPVSLEDGARPAPASGVWTPRWLAISFLSGVVALAYEVVFFRIFQSYFGATAYVFAILLFAYLVMMAAGNYLFGRLSTRFSTSRLFLIIGIGALGTSLLSLWGQEALHLAGLRQNYLVLWPFATWLFYVQVWVVLAAALFLMLPVLFISGFFVAIVHGIGSSREELGIHSGVAYFVQTLGNFSGVLLTGLLWLGTLGTSGSMVLLGALVMLIVLLVRWREIWSSSGWRPALAGLLLMGGLVICYPESFYRSIRFYREGDRTSAPAPTAIREDAFGATLSYHVSGRAHVYVGRLFSNSYQTQPESIEDFSHLFPFDWIASIGGLEVRNILYIGLGSGESLYFLRKIFPGASIDAVELNPALFEMMKADACRDVQEAMAASNIIIMDGRRFVNRQKQARYDLIHVGVFNAWCAGCGNVFTQEFLTLLGSRLRRPGIVTCNAYPPAVQAALGAFEEVSVISLQDRRISEVCAANFSAGAAGSGIQFEPERLLALYARLEKEIGAAALETNRQYARIGGVIHRDRLREVLRDIPAATDDKPATEYYLTNPQFLYDVDWLQARPERDMRMFLCDDCPHPFASLFAAVSPPEPRPPAIR